MESVKVVPSDEDQELEQLRALAFRDDARDGVELVEHKGKYFEVRPPTIEEDRRILSACKDKKSGEVNSHRLVVKMIIATTYLANSERKVFTVHDEDALMKRRSGKDSLIVKLVEASRKTKALDDKEIDTDFEDAPTSSSSTS